MTYYIVYTEGYDEPMHMVGPFHSYDAAIDAHYRSIIEAGHEPEEGETAHEFYMQDDAVRIGRVEANPAEEDILDYYGAVRT